MDDLLNAVTLVVKAPNQKVADQTVQCGMGWTIRKLKSHLSSVYPNKPHEKEQKIIYSGKLLQDDTVLKDVLKLYDDDQTTHIVHLVCRDNNLSMSAPSQPWPASSASSRNNTDSNPETVHPSDVTSEGLRHRTVAPESSQSPPQQHTTAADGQPTVYNTMYPGMMPYSPDQIFWMQQMYAQQMMAYMQYMQQGSYPAQLPPGTATPNVALADATHPNAANQAANQQAAAEQPVRMNAQGGPVMDDDEDVANNDWLDWVYTFCRFSVLLSIIYFYSTLGRFVMVFGFFVLMYLFQAGWFRLRRRDVNRPRQQQQPQPVPAGNAEQAEPERPDQDAPLAEEVAPPTTQTETSEPRTPGLLRVIVSFFMTFFTSLIPQQPPAVNAN